MMGGNLKFKEFLESFDLIKDNINFKYKTNAAKFYRDNLDNIMNGRDLEMEPSYEKGRELFEFESNIGSGGLMAFGSDDLIQDERKVDSAFKQNWEKGKKKVTTWGLTIGKGFNSIITKTKQKFESKKKEEEPKKENDDNEEENKEEKPKSKARQHLDKNGEINF